MSKLRLVLVVGTALVVAVAWTATASAAPKTGCGAEASGWSEQSVEAAAATIWEGILDPTPFPGGLAEFTEVVRGVDANGEGNICLRINWGDQPNENGHWFGVELFIAVDNNANGSNK